MLSLFVFVFMAGHYQINAAWVKEITCPLVCTCRVEVFTDVSIHRFTDANNDDHFRKVPRRTYSNNVFHDEDDLDAFPDSQEGLIQTATCILQTETVVEDLLDALPIELVSLIIIQGVDAGNKTLRLSQLVRFAELQILELRGASLQETGKLSSQIDHLSCDIDTALPSLKYLNIEWLKLNNGRTRLGLTDEETDQEPMNTFKYVQPSVDSQHTLTFLQAIVSNSGPAIQPYATYVKTRRDTNSISFAGFSSILLLRIIGCELNVINYDMFAGLNTLRYLSLEQNGLREVPEFAFYGTRALKSLSLAGNELLSIRIADLAGLLELEYLDLARNKFTVLSELSLPPFPRLQLANFASNPINVIYPNTFEVMNTTESLIVGGEDLTMLPLTLLANSFMGLNRLQRLSILNVQMTEISGKLFVGMPILHELQITGIVTHIAYDTFLTVSGLEKLTLHGCNIYNISVDAFLGLRNLRLLDLSSNRLEQLSPATFDGLEGIREIYLQNNYLTHLAKGMFADISPKLVRLEENPWRCSCDMSDWRPTIVNRHKEPIITNKQQQCLEANTANCPTTIYRFKYVYDNKVAPRCAEPRRMANISVFHALRKLRCGDFKVHMRKPVVVDSDDAGKQEEIGGKILRKRNWNRKYLKTMKRRQHEMTSNENNEINVLHVVDNTDNNPDLIKPLIHNNLV